MRNEPHAEETFVMHSFRLGVYLYDKWTSEWYACFFQRAVFAFHILQDDEFRRLRDGDRICMTVHKTA